LITISGTKKEIYDFIEDHMTCPYPYECPPDGLDCTEYTINTIINMNL